MSAVSSSQVRTYRASDGYELRYRHWPAGTAEPCGHVVALHGIQSHSGWYEFSSARIAAAGFEVSFLDRRGSGLNSADRGHAPHADRLVNDVVQFLGTLRHERTNRAAAPIVLLGVSWGGKLAAVTAAARPELVNAVALLYPGIRAKIRPRPDQRAALRLASAVGIRNRRRRIPLDDPALFTGEACWQQFIREDPLAIREASVAFLSASVELDRRAEEAPPRIACPLLMMLAGRDRIIDNAATRRWFGESASKERTLIEYRDAAHTLEFEPDRERFVTALTEWLARLPAPSR